MNSVELLAMTRRERDRLDALVASLTPEQLTQGGLEGGWSVKDVLAHITAWERRCTWTLATERGDPLGEPEAGVGPDDVGEFNAAAYAANRDRDLDDVLADAALSYAALLDAVAEVPDSALDLPGTVSWTRQRPLSQYIRDNADEHYREHTAQIEAWRSADGQSQ